MPPDETEVIAREAVAALKKKLEAEAAAAKALAERQAQRRLLAECEDQRRVLRRTRGNRPTGEFQAGPCLPLVI